LHIAATALHYGQAAFEGLKAFRCRDGKVRLFRPQANARRLLASARRLCMQGVPEPMFMAAVIRAVRENIEFVPPCDSGGALYVRPLLIGSGPQIGVKPAAEYRFIVLVTPVGPYYRGGLKPVRGLVVRDYDRAAPLGVGSVKAAGNYAAGMEPHHMSADRGCMIELYLDARTHSFVDEFGTSNFVGITRSGTYITPDSHSILPSITNDSLQRLAADLGIPVEVRPVPYTEVPSLAEIGACGTATVITPVNELVDGDRIFRIGPADGCGPILTRLYTLLTQIQTGGEPDRHGWTVEV
jgi:branched-chain amino acid aminotransferase